MKKFISFFIILIFSTCISFAMDTTKSSTNTTIQTEESTENSNSDNHLGNTLSKFVSSNTQIPDTTYLAVANRVPTEIIIANAIIDGFNYLADMLYPFFSQLIITILIILFMFWIMGEGGNFIATGSGSIQNYENMAKKALFISVWIILIRANPVHLFMDIMGPIIQLGTSLSDATINSLIGFPSTGICETITTMVNNDTISSATPFFSPTDKANLLCLTGRISQLYTQIILQGFRWINSGLIFNPIAFIVGSVLVALFIWVGLKFMIESLGIIFDIILNLIMLPFCAIPSCFKEDLSFKGWQGIPSSIFSSIKATFSFGNINTTATNIIRAVIYFFTLSIIAGICYVILADTLNMNPSILTSIPNGQNNSFFELIIGGAISGYLISHAPKYAEYLGGSIVEDSSKKISAGLKTAYDSFKKTYQIFKKKS